MKTKKCLSLIIFVAALQLLCVQTVFGGDIDIFGRNFHINGYIEQEFGIGVGNNKAAGRIQEAYSTLQVEWSYQLTDKISLYSINRLTGDLAYDINSDKDWWQKRNHTPAQRTVSREKNQWEWQNYDQGTEIIREIYLDIMLEKWSFRIGKQQIVWGETDGLRLMDIVNPQDFRRQFNLYDSDEGYEKSRIPLWIIKAMYFPNWEPFGVRDLQYEFIVNLGKTRSNRLEAYQGSGGMWAANEPNLPYLVRAEIIDKRPGTSSRNMEYGLRIMGDWNNWIFTLNGFYGLEHDPYLRPAGLGLSAPDSDGRILSLAVEKRYAWKRIIGFTLNRELEWIKFMGTTSPVLRVESTFQLGKTFIFEGDKVGDMAWTGLNPASPVYKRQFDEIRTMIGFDWNIYIRALNKRESFFFSAQFFLFYLPNHTGETVNAPFYFKNDVKSQPAPPIPGTRSKYNDPWRVHKTQKYCSLGINTLYDNKRIDPYVLFLYDFEEHAFGMKAKLTFKYGSHWRPQIGYIMWTGDHDTGKSFGLFQKNSEMYVKIMYQF